MKKHIYAVDYHIHSNLSVDGHDSIDDICRCAIENRLNEIAITDHFEPNFHNPDCRGTYDAQKMNCEIAAAREKYAGQLKILKGVETGQSAAHREVTETLISENDYDFIIGSVHFIDDKTDMPLFPFNSLNYRTAFEKYFAALYETAKLGLYDCIGHLDYPKRYAAMHGIRMSHGYYMDVIEAIFKTVIQQGKGIELNYSGLRQKIAETLPTADIIRLYRSMGGINITIGSDAHRLAAIGDNTARALEILKSTGFNYITLYEKRKPKYLKI